jgi:glycosyltransferase involved in cell wall biosynthesis
MDAEQSPRGLDRDGPAGHSKGKPNRWRVHALSVVLPAFNEEANIEEVVRSCVTYLADRLPDYELLIVNDGSGDRTGEILDRLATEFPHLRPLRHPRNLGYGAALRTGFEAATKRFIFFMDSDGQFDIGDLDLMIPLVTDNTHIVAGFRINRRDPLVRRLNARLFGGFLVRLLLGVCVRDLNCAFKIIPKEVLEQITLESTGALINAELCGRALRHGFGIKEVGVHHYPRTAGAPTGARASVIVKAFYDLVRLRHKIVRGTRVKKES